MRICVALLLAFMCEGAGADPFTERCADRDAVERVYYAHRTGTKPPFSEVLSRSALEQLVRTDMRKERLLLRLYHTEITERQIDAEIARIDQSTRAPEILRELKQALGNDSRRFGRAVVSHMLVDTELRDRFANDDSLHFQMRHQIEGLRSNLLAAQPKVDLLSKINLARNAGIGEVSEIKWLSNKQTARIAPETTNGLISSGGPYSLRPLPESSLSSNGGQKPADFSKLPARMQSVLKSQLQKPGDVSAVIELPTEFLLCILKERSPTTLVVASVVLRKRNYDDWLAEQLKGLPSEP